MKNVEKKPRCRRFLCLLLLLSAIGQVNIASAQPDPVKVSGRVTEASTGNPVASITVTEKGTSNQTATNEQGIYEISVTSSGVLVFSGLEYASQEIAVGNNSAINVVLQAAVMDLEEVVVVGYGQQKSVEITSAISKVRGEDLDERPISRVDHAMAGKLSGVQVQEASGSPGRSFTVKVRGVSSISNSNAPLYVVDGFPVSSGLDNINPADIESIEVLKDAASAAIYGSRGSNGVVLVTTKTGKSGKPVISLDSYYGIQERFSKVDVLNRDEYIDFAIEERNNSWILQGGKASDPNSARSNANYWIDPLWISDPTSFPDNDWQELISRKAPVQSHQLSASGASDFIKYYLSGNFFNQQGIILGSDFSRLSFRGNIEAKVNNRLTLGLNLSANALNRNDSDGDGNQGPVSRSARVAPIVGLQQQTQQGGYYPYHAAFYLNPISLATEITNKTNTKNILANLYASVNLAKNLDFRTSFGTDYSNGFVQFFKPDNVNRGLGHTGRVNADFRENYLTENILIYRFDTRKLNLNAMAGFTYQEDTYTEANLTKSGFADDEIRTLNMGTLLNSGGSSATAWSLMSFLGRVNASWDEKYLLSASLRRDGSSRFGSDNRWGWFPAVSLGWRISEESFMQEVEFINKLKLRASYGAAGNNNIGNYAAIGALNQTNYVLGSSQQVMAGFSPAGFSNRLLGWERTHTVDVGFDLSVLRNRVSLTLDYYKADVKDLLLNVQIPAVSGFSNAMVNVGAIRNQGVELELNTVNLTGPFKWSTAFNISHNKNTVTALGPDSAPIYGYLEGFNVTITQVGQPIGSYYLFEQEGVFRNQEELDNHPHYRVQNVGDIKYRDVNNDGVIDEDDRVIAGNNNPKFFWGMQNTFNYRSFDLTVAMDGQWGNKLLNIGISQHGQSRGNVDGYWRDRWRSPENPGNGWVPRAAVTANLTTPSTFWLRNASFFRVRTAALGYQAPARWFEQTNAIKSIRLYASVDNVYMHDHYNRNPQTGTWSNSNTVPGADFDATYPLARTYTVGLNAKF